eukprot:TRINITY_DN7492_c0_g1_i1.p1 TRINITY_DN7492_c0_g1~~TRINITY_DN7492_c0_g1_i1.p1  ORF type:complete len:457 (+),score=67.90 TRINITY_DN7492_c0_g1_i1:67-1437(+)
MNCIRQITRQLFTQNNHYLSQNNHIRTQLYYQSRTKSTIPFSLRSREDQISHFQDRSTYSPTLHKNDSNDLLSLLPETYHNPNFYDLERELIFKRSWVCVGLDSQLREPGQVKTIDLVDQPILLTVATDRKIRGFYNVCRHRGSCLVNTPAAKQRILRCPYHAWSYSLEGKLLATPQIKNEDREIKKEDYGLLPVHVEKWGPFVFVNLAEEKPISLKEYLGDLFSVYSTRFPEPPNVEDDWDAVASKNYELNANWKLLVENFVEWYHLPTIHPALTSVSEPANHVDAQGNGMYTSFATSPWTNNGCVTDIGYTPTSPHLTDVQANSAYFVQVFPNLLLFFLPSHVLSIVVIPKGPGKSEETMSLLVERNSAGVSGKNGINPNAETLAKYQEIMKFWDQVNGEDVGAMEIVQRGIRSTPFKGGVVTDKWEHYLLRFQRMVIDAVSSPTPYSAYLKSD